MNMSDMTKKLYPVTGMHCAACATNVSILLVR
jgi:P-type Cu2+ transporter